MRDVQIIIVTKVDGELDDDGYAIFEVPDCQNDIFSVGGVYDGILDMLIMRDRYECTRCSQWLPSNKFRDGQETEVDSWCKACEEENENTNGSTG